MSGYLELALAGILGWFIFEKIKMPVAPLVGAMCFVGAGGLLGLQFPVMPGWTTVIFQIAIGIFIGLKVDREKLKALKSSIFPAGLVVFWTIISTLIFAFMLMKFTGLSITTSLLGATPGGVAEMSILALAFGADVAAVTLLQFLRMITILMGIPFIVTYLSRGRGRGTDTDKTVAVTKEIGEFNFNKETVFLVLAGTLGGVLFSGFNFPAGGLVGAMLGSGLVRVARDNSRELPEAWQQLAQVGLGITIGLKFSRLMLDELVQMWFPVLLFSLAVIVSGIILGFIIKQISGWDLPTCLLASAPGGLSQMVIVGESLGADGLKISVLQLIRLLTILIIIPILLQWYLQ